MVLLLLLQAFRAHAAPGYAFLVGKGCPVPYVALRIAVLVGTVVGVLILGPSMGAVGVALVQCVMSLVTAVVVSGLLAREAHSAKSVFVGDALVLLGRFFTWRSALRRRSAAEASDAGQLGPAFSARVAMTEPVDSERPRPPFVLEHGRPSA
jgi:hypothetical protein